ncbi:sugar porter family MFS transporter [Parapedobacter pyrenivorans]|uniref:sugar porter family MFS transporter n=1 Tax=Parapedobacter pyrenivorans TaxID=1305674 RepID=UPI0033418160
MNYKRFAYTLMVSLVAAIGGFLFGYDWVVIGGAKPFYEVYFGIANKPLMQGWVMGSAIVGCIGGVIISGSFSDKFGRKPLMLVASIIFLVSAIGTGIANELFWLIIYRLLGGVGIGIASALAPLYIAEIVPAKSRGIYVSINQLTIVLGILIAQVVNWMIADPVIAAEDFGSSWNVTEGWRWMFWACGVPALTYIFLLLLIPESPRWLIMKGRYEKATAIFTRIGGEVYAEEAVRTTKKTSATANRIAWQYFFTPPVRKVLIIGIVIAAFQQWCGINVIFNYAQEVFEAAGYGVSDILFNIVITGATNVVFTLVGMYAVDRIGRRTLMVGGSLGLMCIYGLMGACYYYQVSGVFVLVLVVAAIACYAMTLAPVTWVVLSEIFPNRIRGRAMAIATFSLWVACFILTYSFPLLNTTLGAYGTFWLYGFVCLLGFLFIKTQLPETRGQTLEEIEQKLTGANL